MANSAEEIKVEPKKVDEPAHEVIDRELLQLLDKYQVLITTFAADRLGLSRQKALWHFHRLRDAGRCHHATTVRAGSRHFVWAAGTSCSMTEPQIREAVLRQHAGAKAESLAGARFKTTFADGVNPWTGETMK